MKSDIDHFLSKVAKVIKGGNFLYLVPKKKEEISDFLKPQRGFNSKNKIL